MFSAPSANARGTIRPRYAVRVRRRRPERKRLRRLPGRERSRGHFVAFPRHDRDRQARQRNRRAAADFGYPAPPTGIPDEPQSVLEYWSHNVVRALQFIRIEGLAYDRTTRTSSTSPARGNKGDPDGRAGFAAAPPDRGPYPNGRIFKMVLDPNDAQHVLSLSVIFNSDARRYDNPAAMRQPDNVETTGRASSSPRIPVGTTRAPPSATPRCDVHAALRPLVPVAQVEQSLRPIFDRARGSRARSSTPRRVRPGRVPHRRAGARLGARDGAGPYRASR